MGITLPDQDFAEELRSQVDRIRREVEDATVALNVRALSRPTAFDLSREAWDDFISNRDLLALNEGRIPPRYAQRLDLMLMHAFALALHDAQQRFRRLREDIAERARLTKRPLPELDQAIAVLDRIEVAFEAEFPGLKGVRNTIHHPEDRDRLRGRSGAIAIAPEPSGGIVIIHSEASSHSLTLLNEDGGRSTVPITGDALLRVVGWLQELIDALPWAGFPDEKIL